MIVAALSWYDERPTQLDACVRSLAGHVDALIAWGGRWRYHPAAGEDASAYEAAAIRDAAEAIGLPVVATVFDPADPWPSQVDKRNQLMRAACRAVEAAELASWLLVIDADERLEATDLRDVLPNVTTNVATVKHSDGRPLRRLFRARPALWVGPTHADYRLAGQWLAGNPPDGEWLEPVALLGSSATLIHERGRRTLNRNAAAREYRNLRRRVGVD